MLRQERQVLVVCNEQTACDYFHTNLDRTENRASSDELITLLKNEKQTHSFMTDMLRERLVLWYIHWVCRRASEWVSVGTWANECTDFVNSDYQLIRLLSFDPQTEYLNNRRIDGRTDRRPMDWWLDVWVWVWCAEVGPRQKQVPVPRIHFTAYQVVL